MAIPWKCFGKNENFWKYVCCRIFVLEQGNSSLSQSVTVYPALPRQPAGDLLATVRMMMMRIVIVMTIIMMSFTKKNSRWPFGHNEDVDDEWLHQGCWRWGWGSSSYENMSRWGFSRDQRWKNAPTVPTCWCYRVSQKKFLIEFLLWERCLQRPNVKTVALLCMLSPRHLNLQLRGCFCAVRVYTLIQHTDEGHSRPPLAQKAKLCFKLLLLQRLDENLKQKHF